MTSVLDGNALLAALNEGGLRYTTRHSTRGTPYAGFRWQCGKRGLLRSFSALLEMGSLRLTLYAPEIKLQSASAAECLALQAPLPLARLYRSAEQPSQTELTLAVPVSGARLDFALLEPLLVHLAHGAEDLEGQPSGAARQAPRLPAPDSALWNSPSALGELLSALGLEHRRVSGAFVVDMELPNLPVKASFHLYHLGHGWLRISAHFANATFALDSVPEERIERLQEWAPVGRFVSPDIAGQNTLGCEVGCPLLGRSPLDVVEDGLHAAIHLLGTAHVQAR